MLKKLLKPVLKRPYRYGMNLYIKHIRDRKLTVRRKLLLKKLKANSKLNTYASLAGIHHIIDSGVVQQTADAKIFTELASFFLNCGQPALAQECFKISLQFDNSPNTYSLYLQCLLLDPFCDDKKLFEEASKYNQFFSHIKKYDHFVNDKNPNRKLNVGYLCHFFHNSVSQTLLTPFLKEHNHERINVFCYSDADPKEVPAHVRECATTWRDTLHLDDEALAEQVRADKIDVLLELNGHCFLNRYGVIARKPVPVQISYYNQCSTTGIDTFDYALIGDEVILDKSSSQYSEEIYFLKGVTGVAKFPTTFPDCAPPPFLKNNYITFGSFGAAHKVNAEVIKLWCKVLKRVPDAKLYMKAGVLSYDDYANSYKAMFRREGIDLARVHLEGHSPHLEMLQCYANVDIGLDTFPHAAGTTTMEATWQGVPVITLAGSKFCSQNGKNILESVGHPELVAFSEEEFVNKASALASDKKQIEHYRAQLRNDFKASPRANPKAFATKLEDAYIDMWQRYCNS